MMHLFSREGGIGLSRRYKVFFEQVLHQEQEVKNSIAFDGGLKPEA